MKAAIRWRAIGVAAALAVGCGGGQVETEEPEPATPAQVTEADMTAVAGHLQRGDASGLRAWLAPSGQVSVALVNSLCDEEEAGPEACVQRRSLDGADAVASWLTESAQGWSAANCDEESTEEMADRCLYPGGFDAEGTVRCDGGCCSIEREGLLHNTLFLDRICFEPTGGPHPRITSIDFTEG